MVFQNLIQKNNLAIMNKNTCKTMFENLKFFIKFNYDSF